MFQMTCFSVFLAIIILYQCGINMVYLMCLLLVLRQFVISYSKLPKLGDYLAKECKFQVVQED